MMQQLRDRMIDYIDRSELTVAVPCPVKTKESRAPMLLHSLAEI
jgi:hypothetical protein